MALVLGVTSDGPTRRRLANHLPAFDVEVTGLDLTGRLTDLTAPPATPPCDVGFVFPSRIVDGDVHTGLTNLPWVNGRRHIVTTRNKAGVLARLAAADVPIPRTVHVSAPADVDAVIDAYRRIDGPVVVKPNATTRGIGHVRVDDVDSLRGVVDYLDLLHRFPATRDRSFILQAYVPEAADLRLTVIDGTVAGAVRRELPPDAAGSWVRNVHRGAEAVGIDPPAAAVDVAERTAARLDVPLVGVDVLDTPVGPLVLEVNGRPTIDRVEKYPEGFYERLVEVIRRRAS